MLFGYCRVSTEAQSVDRQIDALKKYGVPEENIYQEKMTGTKKHRPALDELKKVLREDDTLVIESFSRLGRSTQNLLELLQEFQQRNIKVISLKENMDFSSATGKLTITIMAALAQFERDLLSERTKEGLAASAKRKNNGKNYGRPKADKKKIEKALKLYDSNQFSMKDICFMSGLGKTTIYKALKERQKK